MPNSTSTSSGPSSISLLNDLLARLYPEPGPNILTLADFKLRYRLTGLGPLAVAAIQQMQRINRDIGRFDEIGLCEFHIGLIYLNLDDYQGAVQQFREARLQWSFVDKTAAVCLAYLAEGVAQQQRFAFETALGLLGKVENYQKRIQFEPSSDNRDGFVAALNAMLQTAQAESRKGLWEAAPPPSATLVEEGETGGDTAVSLSASSSEKKQVLPPSFSKEPVTPSSPIPQHPNTSQTATWYQVRWQQPAPTFATVKDGSWLLTLPPALETTCQQGALLIITSEAHDQQASIMLDPLQKRAQPSPHFYLARKDFAGPFTPTGNQITLSAETPSIAVDFANIKGCVIGLWLEMGESEILES